MTSGDTVPPDHQPKVPREHWPQIRAQYPAKAMRQLAAEWGACQATIRKIWGEPLGPAPRRF